MFFMENEFLKVSVTKKGAELQSVFQKEMGKEVLWQGDKKYWGRRSPILFPNVGRHYGDFYLYQGKKYVTTQHGFARDMNFECEEQEPERLVFSLKDTPETREYFPFPFVLRITYTLKGRSLQVLWEVENPGEQTMYFTIGGHPAFYVPILEGTVQTDYKLLFQKGGDLEYRLVYGEEGTADMEKSYLLSLEDCGEYEGCPVTSHMFDRDALIFDGGQISMAGIGYPNGSPYILMDCPGFSTFGIWTVPGAPYICLEPWMGRCDDHGFEGEISQKPDILSLEPQKTFSKGYTVTIYKER